MPFCKIKRCWPADLMAGSCDVIGHRSETSGCVCTTLDLVWMRLKLNLFPQTWKSFFIYFLGGIFCLYQRVDRRDLMREERDKKHYSKDTELKLWTLRRHCRHRRGCLDLEQCQGLLVAARCFTYWWIMIQEVQFEQQFQSLSVKSCFITHIHHVSWMQKYIVR